MHFFKKFVYVIIFMFGMSLLSIYGTAQRQIDVEKLIKQRVNANPALKAQLIKRIFNEDVNGDDYKLNRFEVGYMNQVSTPRMDLNGLPVVWKFVTAKEVLNCTGDPVTKTLTLTGTTTSTKTITKTMNFSLSYSGTVGINFEIISGSATSTWTAGYTQSWTDTESESHTATDSTQVQLNERGGRVYTLESKHLEGTIPYEAVFEILDDSPILVEFVGKDTGYIFVYQHINFQGNGNKYTLGAVPQLPDSMNNCISSIKVRGGVRGILYGLKNYGGKHKAFLKDTNWVGQEMNDKASSLKVKRQWFRRDQPVLRFSEIKDLIPFNDRRFITKGKMAVDYSWPTPVTRVTIASLSEDYFNTSCGTSASGGYQAGLPGTSLKTKTLTQAEIQRLRNSGKIK